MTLSQEHKHLKSLCGVSDGFQRARLGHKGPVVLSRAKCRKRRPRGKQSRSPKVSGERPAQVWCFWSTRARGTCRGDKLVFHRCMTNHHTPSAEAKSLCQFTVLSIRGQPLSTVCQPVECSSNGWGSGSHPSQRVGDHHSLGHSHPSHALRLARQEGDSATPWPPTPCSAGPISINPVRLPRFKHIAQPSVRMRPPCHLSRI